MRTAEQITDDFNKASERYKKDLRLDVRAVKAAMRIRERMLDSTWDTMGHPSGWNENTIIFMTGAIMKEYGNNKL